MGRKILFITTDQQRYDTVGANGGTIARTPVVDKLASEGIRYERCQPSSVVCMPSRASMLTGQFPTTHGAWMNGVALRVDAPSFAEELHDAGYATALIGKSHFEPFLDVFGRFAENSFAQLGIPTIEQPWFDGRMGPHRGFDHMEFATHGIARTLHYGKFITEEHPEYLASFYPNLNIELHVNDMGGGDTGAVQAWSNNIPKELYHTDWIADRTINWLEQQNEDSDWFCWMSFPDPHHPWDPPKSEVGRIDWKDVPLPENYPEAASEREALLDQKAAHWRLWYDGKLVSNYEAPKHWVPSSLTADQLREITALNAVEIELIDEAIGRVLKTIEAKGWTDDVDIVFTTDHGELGGDFGLLFKGAYHVDGLMRLPLIWKPAPSSNTPPAVVGAPVSLVSLAATFMEVAGLPTPAYVEAGPLPVNNEDAKQRNFDATITEWDSDLFGVSVHVRTALTNEFMLTEYQKGTVHNGNEGELYNLIDDPLQRVNHFNDPAYAGVQAELSERIHNHEVRPVEKATPGLVVAPV